MSFLIVLGGIEGFHILSKCLTSLDSPDSCTESMMAKVQSSFPDKSWCGLALGKRVGQTRKKQ